MAISMIDLTTLEGADTEGKVRSLCAKALVPDPSSMLLFSADPRFRSGLETAWRTGWTARRRNDRRGRRGRSRRIGAVLWSLRDADGPVDHVQDISLTAVFTQP